VKIINLLLIVLLLAACNKQDLPPTVPKGLQVSPQDRAVALEWSANSEADLRSYLVSVTLPDGALVTNQAVDAPANRVVISELNNGTSYTFRLAAEDKAGNRSAFSAPVTATPGLPNTPPTRPTGFVASAQDAQVLLTWSRNPEPNLAGYTLFYGTDAAALDQSKPLPASAVSTVVAGLINGTAYFFALEAENAAGLKSPRSDVVAATPQNALEAPIVKKMMISGYDDSTQVRQGAGRIEVILYGDRLDTLTSVKLLGAFDFEIVQQEADSVRLSGIVPHGLEIGTRTLLVVNAGGETSLPDAIEITKITAAKTPGLNPSDTTGVGTPNRPFLTLTKALSVAASGDTVLLGAGTYDVGEAWSKGGSFPNTTNVPTGVTIEGQSSDRGAVLLQGPGNDQSTDGLVFAGSASVLNLSLRGFRYALFLQVGSAGVRSGKLLVSNVAAFDNFVGLWVGLAESLTVTESALRNNVLNANSGWGMFAQGVARVEVSNTEVIGNYTGMRLTNLTQPVSAEAVLSGVVLSENAMEGLRITSVSTDIASTRVDENTGAGIRIGGKPGFLAIRSGTVIENNSGIQLLDERDPYQGSFTVWHHALPGSGVKVGQVMGPTGPETGIYYRIVNAGNAILFQ
jgi:chitodextrinase